MKYFKIEEFKCKCGQCGSTGFEMNALFVEKLDTLRKLADFPFIISSGYRCPEYNVKVSSTGLKGPHTTGKAADILTNGENAYNLAKLAIVGGFTGIGFKQHGPQNGRFIHLDILTTLENYPRPRIWSY